MPHLYKTVLSWHFTWFLWELSILLSLAASSIPVVLHCWAWAGAELPITATRPEGRWTNKTCWLPCCARVQAGDQEEAAGRAAAAVEPNFPWASPDSPAPAWAQQALPAQAPGCQAGCPRAARWARTVQTFPPPIRTILCSWSAMCASLLMCFCNSKKFSTPKVCLDRNVAKDTLSCKFLLCELLYHHSHLTKQYFFGVLVSWCNESYQSYSH